MAQQAHTGNQQIVKRTWICLGKTIFSNKTITSALPKMQILFLNLHLYIIFLVHIIHLIYTLFTHPISLLLCTYMLFTPA